MSGEGGFRRSVVRIPGAVNYVLAEGPNGRPRHATVALADDFVLLREGLAAICELSGVYHVVAQSSDGASALDSLRVADPDVAVVDFKLPGLSALELLGETQRSGLRTKILVMADQRDRKTAVEVLRAGGRGVLLDSDTSREVLLAFEQVVSGGIYLSPAFSLSEVFAWTEEPLPGSDPLDRLSSREYQVFALLVEGVRPKEIASRLHLSPKTVDTYRASLMKKLDIHHVAGLVRFAMDRELRAQTERLPEGEPDSELAHGGANGSSAGHSAYSDATETLCAPGFPQRSLSAASGGHISNRTPSNLYRMRLSH